MYYHSLLSGFKIDTFHLLRQLYWLQELESWQIHVLKPFIDTWLISVSLPMELEQDNVYWYNEN